MHPGRASEPSLEQCGPCGIHCRPWEQQAEVTSQSDLFCNSAHVFKARYFLLSSLSLACTACPNPEAAVAGGMLIERFIELIKRVCSLPRPFLSHPSVSKGLLDADITYLAGVHRLVPLQPVGGTLHSSDKVTFLGSPWPQG